MSNKHFLRNETRRSQNQAFVRRQWAQHLLFFVLLPTSFPINLTIIVCCQSIFSQKCSPKFSKAKFRSKTVSTMFAVFFLNSTSQENCGAGINNGAIKCRLFVDKYLKPWLWVSYTFLQKPSLFNHFWIRASFSRNFFVCKINDFGEINIWRSWWRRNVMRKKIHLLIN